MKFFGSMLEAVAIAAIAVFAVILCRQYVFNPYAIAGASMAPSFHDGDYVFVDQLSYRLREPRRGEVIVFHSPSGNDEDLVKRIVALPGETVMVRDGQVVVVNQEHPQGLTLSEGYLDPLEITTGSSSITLDDGEYFVMGDNRSVSFDSRSWGPLDEDGIVGMVRLRIWPLDEAHAFTAPQY